MFCKILVGQQIKTVCLCNEHICGRGKGLQKLANILRDKFQEVSKVPGIGHLHNITLVLSNPGQCNVHS